ncbi:MAG: uroporphyrinogen decarboxylase family protein [Armatimonadota bacterium]|nr:uroporphyrinogen decarboxylase family protein [Armatimonadota bacterium]MDR7550304.1 uroporphyrinogen decarboxylase family protein [Armatimonadota bacterium]
MKLFPTQEIGSLAKPAWLVKATRGQKPSAADLAEIDRWAERLGIENAADLKALLASEHPDRERLRDWAALFAIRLEEAAGLDVVYDGEARRVEMYEYPVRRIAGFHFYGHVRSFDNKYYRKAAVVDRVRLTEPFHLDELRFVKSVARRPVKVPITGPYTLADWSFNEYYLKTVDPGIRDLRARAYAAKRAFTLDLARDVLRPVLQALAAAGADWIQIDEPAAATHPDEVPILVEAFNEAVDGVRAKISIHICYSNYRALYPHLLTMRTDHLALEFKNTGDYNVVQLFKEYGDRRELGLGVVDVHTDVLETPEEIRDKLLDAAAVLGAERIWANPDCGLRTRTWEVAFAKLVNLVEGARLAREALAART